MKFEIIAMVAAGANALKQLTGTAVDCTDAANANKCVKAAYVATTGVKGNCHIVTRGADTTKKTEYWNNDFHGVYATLANLESGEGYVCGTTQTNTTPTGPDDQSATKVCSNVANSGAATVKSGYGVMGKGTGMILADGKSPLWGSSFCPQADDVCDSDTTKGFGTKKLKTFASASDAAVTVKLSDKLADTSSCSYFIEATCDAPYVEYKASPSSWPTTGA